MDGIATARAGDGWVRAATALIVAALIALSVATLARTLTDTPNQYDAAQNMAAAYNLAVHGVFSQDIGPDPAPGMTREPLPIVALAAHMRLHPGLDVAMDFETMNSGAAVIAVKRHNLLWAAGLLAGVFVLVQTALGPSRLALPAGILAMAMTHAFFLGKTRILDTTYTEVQAATLMVWGSVALVRALQTGRSGWFLATGLLLGALALTKAVMLHVGIGVVLCLFVVHVLFAPAGGRMRALAQTGLLALGLALVAGPWIMRNAIVHGEAQITGRSGEVMMIRAVLNGMSDEERRGAYTAWGPGKYLVPILGQSYAFGPEDFEEGGRLQRLNRLSTSTFAERDRAAEAAGRPQDAISYYRSAKAESVRLALAYAAEGHADPSSAADSALRAQAIEMVRSDPGAHLALTPAIVWRIVWNFQAGVVPGPVRFGLNAAAFALLWVFAILGLLTRNPVMLGIGLAPVGMIALYVLATHAIARYSEPAVPNMIVALVVALAWTTATLAARLRRPRRTGASRA